MVKRLRIERELEKFERLGYKIDVKTTNASQISNPKISKRKIKVESVEAESPKSKL